MSSITLKSYPLENISQNIFLRDLFSNEGLYINNQRQLFKNYQEDCITFGWRTSLINEVEQLFNALKNEKTCTKEENSLYIHQHSRDTSKKLIDQFPNDIIVPEIGADDNGSVTFDWYLRKNYIFSISVNKSMVIYAAILGSYKPKGEFILEENIPSDFLSIFKDYFSK